MQWGKSQNLGFFCSKLQVSIGKISQSDKCAKSIWWGSFLRVILHLKKKRRGRWSDAGNIVHIVKVHIVIDIEMVFFSGSLGFLHPILLSSSICLKHHCLNRIPILWSLEDQQTMKFSLKNPGAKNWRWYSYWRCWWKRFIVVLSTAKGCFEYFLYVMGYCYFRFRDRISLFATTVNSEVLELMSKMLLWEASCVFDLAVCDRVLDAIGPDMFASETDCIKFACFEENRSPEMKNWWIKMTMKLAKYIYIPYYPFYYLVLLILIHFKPLLIRF